MADKRISALTAAATLDKTEVFPIVQGGVTVKATIAQALAPLTILQSDAGTMLAGVPAYPVDGQVYLLTSLGITGVDHIRTVGIVDANTADFVFNNNCEAYLDGLGVYVPCTYDVATNSIRGSYVIWAGNISQSGGADATIDYTSVNLLGETPTFEAQGSGQLIFTNTIFSFPQYKTILYSPHVYIAPNLWSPSLEWSSSHELFLWMVKGDGSAADDIYNNTYIEISILF